MVTRLILLAGLPQREGRDKKEKDSLPPFFFLPGAETDDLEVPGVVGRGGSVGARSRLQKSASSQHKVIVSSFSL